MASAYGNTVHHWRSRVVADITSQTATRATVRTRAYWCSINYGYDVYANGEAVTGSYSSGKKQFVAKSGTGQSVETLVAEVSHTYDKGAKEQSIPCKSVVQVTGGFGNGTSTASTSVSIPAIDYDAPEAPSDCSASRSSDAQAKVTWSNGATGTTTPRSATLVERQADGGEWEQVASVGASAENWTDNSISANHRYRYRVRANGAGGNSDYATSGYIYTTPAAPSSVLAEKTGAQSVRLSIEGAAPWATSYDVERSTDGGSQWESAGAPASFPWVDADAPAGTVAYRVRAVRGSLQSAWAQSNSVTTITPPLAPAVTGLPNVAATGSVLTVSWSPNHPDGSAQTQAQVEYTVGDGSPQTATVQGSATSYQLPESVTESAATVKVRVRTHGLDPDWGAWSGYSTVTVAVPPSAHFTNPAQDGAVIEALPLALAWEASDATGIASQTLTLLGADGTTLLTRQLDGAARSFVIDDSVYALSNLTAYELVLTVLGGSSLSTVAGRSFTTDWAEPSMPEAELDVDPADLSCAVTVHAGGTEGAEASVAEIPAGKTVGGAVVYGNTRQNLWVNPATATMNGVTLTANADSSITLSGTATADTWIFITVYNLKQSTRYTLSVDKAIQNGSEAKAGLYIEEFDGADSSTTHAINDGQSSVSFTTKDDVKRAISGFFAYTGAVLTGTYRIMLNEGSEPEPWCPPGLNSVDELSIVTAGKNLLARMGPSLPYTIAGITFSDNGDGGIRISGTATSSAYYNFFNESVLKAPYIMPGEYTASLTGQVNGVYLSVEYYINGIGGDHTTWLATNAPAVPRTGSIDRPVYVRSFISVVSGMTVDAVVYPQLELGSTATAYEPPMVTTTPIDLDGHALNSLPDGTRDELRIEPGGSCSIAKASGETVELPPVAMSFDGPGHMWADANVPATVKPVYMVGSSFSVTRILPDGSQWLVADGLTDGQQCIDPLPPLNVDFSYLVTAYAETGVSSALIVPARVEAVLAAFNFGDAAATCELARLDPSWSHSPKRSGTLYHFADGGESGGLPVPYGGMDVDSTRSMGFTLLDLGQLRRLQELAARYYTCWFRDVYGGRALCAVSWSFSSGVPYGKVEVSADMTEAVFEEAW